MSCRITVSIVHSTSFLLNALTDSESHFYFLTIPSATLLGFELDWYEELRRKDESVLVVGLTEGGGGGIYRSIREDATSHMDILKGIFDIEDDTGGGVEK